MSLVKLQVAMAMTRSMLVVNVRRKLCNNSCIPSFNVAADWQWASTFPHRVLAATRACLPLDGLLVQHGLDCISVRCGQNLFPCGRVHQVQSLSLFTYVSRRIRTETEAWKMHR